MITDLFAGGQNLELSALIANINTGASKGKSQKGNDLDGISGIDFAALLNKTMNDTTDEVQSSSDNEVAFKSRNSISADNMLTLATGRRNSFIVDGSSSFMTIDAISERNSFQSSLNVSSSRQNTSANANLSSEKSSNNVQKETKKVDNKDTEDSKTASVEKEEETKPAENAKTSEEVNNEEATDSVELDESSLAGMVLEEEPEIAVEGAEEELAVADVNLEMSAEEVPEETVKAEEVQTETEDQPELVDQEQVIAANAENLNNLQKVNTEETSDTEEISAVAATDTENQASELKVADTAKDNEEVKEEEGENESDSKEEISDSQQEEAFASQFQQAEVKEENTESTEETVEASEASAKKVATNNANSEEKAENSDESKSEEKPEELTAASEKTEVHEAKAKDSEKSSEEKPVEAEKASEETVSEDKEPKAKAESKSENDSKLDKVVETLKEDKTTVQTESLRDEFARMTGQDKSNSENMTSDLSQQAGVSVEQQGQVAATTTNTAEDTANKILAAIAGKAEGNHSKNDVSHLTVEAGSAGKGSAMNQHTGSNANSGFSFQSGTPQTYDQHGKVAQSPNAPATNFSELLTKAEMVKTKDGAKVLNVEVEQEGMGKLEVELTSKDGIVTAKLSAESDMAKIKLEELAPKIKESLQEQGVNLTEISVDVSSKDADKNGSEYQNSGKKNKSNRLGGIGKKATSENIKQRIIPNLRRAALNIQSVDLTV